MRSLGIIRFTATALAAGLVSCASLPDWTGPTPGGPADPNAAVRAYTPPQNPFAAPLAQDMDGAETPDSAAHDMQFECPMHPEVKSAEPGTCPKCGMTLRSITTPAEDGGHAGGAR